MGNKHPTKTNTPEAVEVGELDTAQEDFQQIQTQNDKNIISESNTMINEFEEHNNNTTSSLPILGTQNFTDADASEFTNSQTLPTPSPQKSPEFQKRKAAAQNPIPKHQSKSPVSKSFVSKIDNSLPFTMASTSSTTTSNGDINSTKINRFQCNMNNQSPREKMLNNGKLNNHVTRTDPRTPTNDKNNFTTMNYARSNASSKFAPTTNFEQFKEPMQKSNMSYSPQFPSNTSTALSTDSIKIKANTPKTNTPNFTIPNRAQTPTKSITSITSSSSKINNIPSFMSTRSRSPYNPIFKDQKNNQPNNFSPRGFTHAANDDVEQDKRNDIRQNANASLPKITSIKPNQTATPSNTNIQEQSANKYKAKKTEATTSKKPGPATPKDMSPTTKKVNKPYTRSSHTQNHIRNVFRTSIHDSIHSPLTRIY